MVWRTGGEGLFLSGWRRTGALAERSATSLPSAEREHGWAVRRQDPRPSGIYFSGGVWLSSFLRSSMISRSSASKRSASGSGILV